MLVRPKRLEGKRERRQTSAGHLAGRPASTNQASPADRRHREQHRSNTQSLSNDRAFYSCQCGYVFEAPVSTSVACPHCGGTQAW